MEILLLLRRKDRYQEGARRPWSGGGGTSRAIGVGGPGTNTTEDGMLAQLPRTQQGTIEQQCGVLL